MSYKHILFDLDGTLTDPALGITNSIMHALKKSGIQPPDRRELYCCIGPPLTDAFMEMWGFSKEGAKKALFDYREYFSQYGLFENEVYTGIPELLGELCESGKKLYLATSKPEIYARQILEHFNLSQYFSFIAGNTLSEDRPKKVDVINHLFKVCPEIDAQNTVMVGDRKYDVIGAHAARLPCIGVLFGYGSEDELLEAGADHLARTVSDLKSLLLNE
ncbi:MAG: HAD family hydrolase [Oscillospiraceae bacterium]|nr:HAD family hydrolase [Oscillospiraceae bacterium]